MRLFGPLAAALLISVAATSDGALAQAQPIPPPLTPAQQECKDKCTRESAVCTERVRVQHPGAPGPVGSPSFTATLECIDAYDACTDVCPK